MRRLRRGGQFDGAAADVVPVERRRERFEKVTLELLLVDVAPLGAAGGVTGVVFAAVVFDEPVRGRHGGGGETTPACAAGEKAREQEYAAHSRLADTAGGVRVDVPGLRRRQVGGAGHAVGVAAIDRASEDASGVGGGQADAVPCGLGDGVADAERMQVRLKERPQPRLRPRIDGESLVPDDVADRRAAGDLAALPLVRGGGADAFGRAVGLVLGDGEHDVDLEASGGRLRLVVLPDGPPADAVRLQDGLHLVVVRDAAKPAVKLCEYDKLDRPGFDVREQTQHGPALCVPCPGGQAGVVVHAGERMAVCLDPGPAVGLLRLDGYAAQLLLLRRYAHIDRDVHRSIPPFCSMRRFRDHRPVLCISPAA